MGSTSLHGTRLVGTASDMFWSYSLSFINNAHGHPSDTRRPLLGRTASGYAILSDEEYCYRHPLRVQVNAGLLSTTAATQLLEIAQLENPAHPGLVPQPAVYRL